MCASDPSFRRLEEGVFIYSRPLGDFGPSVTGVIFLAAGASLVVDTLCSPGDMEVFSKMASGRQVFVAYTHADWDHCLGTGAFCAPIVIGHEFARGRLLAPTHPELDAVRSKAPDLVKGGEIIIPGITFTNMISVDLERTPAQTSVGAKSLIRGASATLAQPTLTGEPSKRRIEIRHLPGHTADSCVAYDVATGVLAAGDAAEDPIPSIGDARSLNAWISGLREWAARARTVVPGHGPVSGPTILKKNAKYLRTVMGLVKDAASKGTAPENLNSEYPLERVYPEAIAALESMRPRDREFYLEAHRENLFRTWTALS